LLSSHDANPPSRERFRSLTALSFSRVWLGSHIGCPHAASLAAIDSLSDRHVASRARFGDLIQIIPHAPSTTHATQTVTLTGTAKADAAQSQFLDCLDELLHRSREPVKFPNNQSIAASGVFERFEQGGALHDRAGHLLDEYLSAPRLFECVLL
jgi:hypothetical protein